MLSDKLWSGYLVSIYIANVDDFIRLASLIRKSPDYGSLCKQQYASQCTNIIYTEILFFHIVISNTLLNA